MALNPKDIATVSRLLDEALALPVAERDAWLAALPEADARHAAALRDMLAQEAELDTDSNLAALPRLAPDESVAHAGDVVGPYRLIREIGRGGMGSVWLAERADGSFKRQVALKLPRLAWGTGLAERMARERDIGALLEHPNIARLYDAGVDERGRPFLALEFIDGQPIDAWCEAQALSVRDRLRLCVAVARAVAYAHGRLVVHRDLKPSNVLVTPDGQVHLLDFGIAKLLQEGAPGEAGLTEQQGRVMTPHYASPEQIAGEAITVQSDVYSLGVLLYELLTGTLPIAPKRGTLGAVEEAILEGDAPLASGRVKDRTTARALRGEVDAILAKAMQREPARRYATADALAQDIERYLSGETVDARPDSLAYRLQKTLRRHWLGVSAATAALVTIGAVTALSMAQALRAERETERSRLATSFVSELFVLNARQAYPRDGEIKPANEVFLDRGAQLINARFENQPDIQAHLYGAVGQVYADIGAGSLAIKYASRQAAILQELRAGTSETIRSRLLLARAMEAADRDAEAEVEAQRAAEMADGSDELRGNALALLGWIQINNGKSELARLSSAEAERLLQAAQAAPSIALSELLFVRANLERDERRTDQAISLAQRAVDNAVVVQGSQSPFAVKLRVWMAQTLLAAGQLTEARALADSAFSTVRGTGAAGEVVAASKQAEWLFSLYSAGHINFEEAEGKLEQARASIAMRSSSVPPLVLAKLELYAGSIKLLWGDLDGAAQLIEPSARLIKAEASHQWLLRFVLRKEAQLAMSLGHHDQASVLLDQRHKLAGEAGASAGHLMAIYDALLEAGNLVMQGNFGAAEKVTMDSMALANALNSTPSRKRAAQSIDLTRAWSRIVQGDVRGATTALNTAEIQPSGNPVQDFDWLVIRGETLCASGRPIEGSSALERAMSSFERRVSHKHPELARLRAVLGHCQLSLGNRQQALKLAMAAREGLEAQSGVSSYFKQRLLGLEIELGINRGSNQIKIRPIERRRERASLRSSP